MAFTIVSVIRLGALSVATFFSLIVLGTAAHILSVTESILGTFWAYIAFAVAVSVLTLLTLPPLIITSIIRSGAAPNYVVVELGWISVLWVLWMASAGFSANQLSLQFPIGCSSNAFVSDISNVVTINCSEFWAVEAFSWLIWLTLMPYAVFLFFMAIIQHSRGNRQVWTYPVHQVNFFAPREGVIPGMVPQQQVYPTQPMVQQPLQQQMPVQYAPGTPAAAYSTPPPQNTGYAQAPVNTGYPPAAAAGYLPEPAGPEYAPAHANTGYTQGPTNPVYSQA